MKLCEQSIKNISSSLAITISLIIAVFIPAMYFIIAYEHMDGVINAEMAFSAQSVESIIVNNPKSWQFEDVRLQEILGRRLDHTHRDNRKIRDLHGYVIAESRESLARPVLTFSQPICDSGTEVASIEIERSIFPLVVRTVLVGACSFGLGIIIFLIYYFFPLRTVREAYDRLQKSERQYKLIAEKMTDIVWVINMDLKVVYVTPSVQTVLGFTQEEIKNQTLEEKLPPTSLSLGLEILARELAIEESGHGNPDRTVTLVLEYYHKDGSIRWMETIMSGLRNDQGVLTGIHGVSRDITERRRMEDALRTSEEKFISAFKNSPGAMCISTTREGRFIDVNDVFLDSLGYKREEVVGRTSVDLNLWVDMVERDAMLRELIETGSAVNVELQFRDKQGNIHWGLSAMSLIKITGETCLLTQTMDITERKRTEKELQQSEERYRTILDEMEEGYEETGLDGNYTFVNDAFLQIFGYNRDEIIGTNFRKYTADKESEKKLIDAYMEIYKTGAPLKENFEWEIIRKDGVRRTCEFHASLRRDAHGLPIGFRGIGRDITDRRQAERILRENEERLRGITQNLPGIIFQFYAKDDGEYGLNYVSEPMAEFSKIATNADKENMETIFPLLLSLIYEEDRDIFLTSIKTAVETRTSWNFEGRITIPSGKMIWVQGLSTPTRLKDRTVFNGILLNITERKLAEEKSSQSEEKFRKIFMTTPELIFITRLKDGLIIDVNKRCEDILGWQREIAVGTKSTEPPLNFWVDPSNRDFMAAELNAGRDVLHHELEFRQRDGSIRAGIYSARSIGNIDGEASLVFILQDITEQKRMERELVESQKMKLMSRIASGVAHEVRNPLHAIQAISEAMAIDMDEKSDYKDYLMHIKSQVTRLSHLMNELLDLGKPIQPSQLNTALLSDIAAASLICWIEAHPQLSQKVKLANKIQSEDPVLVDTDKIQQVIINLMDNACQHSPQDEKILLEIGKASEDYLRVKVIDRGAGIKLQDQPKVFEPFYTTRKGGTGLGLSLCKHIIESHGGTIEIVNNEKAPGCTAQFTLPINISKEHQ